MAVIGVLGPAGTFTDEAARKAYPDARFQYYKGVADVFKAVVAGDCEFGIVPIENSIEGSVSETIRGLEEYDVNVCGELYHSIQHVLAGKGSLSGVKTIYSHEQAVAQCRKKLQKLFKKMPRIVTRKDESPISTAFAMKLVSESDAKTSAAIGSANAAKRYGLKVLARDLSEQKDNETRFFLISKGTCPVSGKDKTSIIVGVKDEPGSLYGLLGRFSTAGINLSKIESRPRRGKKWEYIFFIDFEGHKDEKKVKEILNDIEENSSYFKLLGSYPK